APLRPAYRAADDLAARGLGHVEESALLVAAGLQRSPPVRGAVLPGEPVEAPVRDAPAEGRPDRVDDDIGQRRRIVEGRVSDGDGHRAPWFGKRLSRPCFCACLTARAHHCPPAMKPPST